MSMPHSTGPARPNGMPDAAPLSDAAPATLGAGSPVMWTLGTVGALVVAAFAGTQHIARAARFDPGLNVWHLAVPGAIATVMMGLAVLLALGAVGAGVATLLKKAAVPLATVLGLVWGAALSYAAAAPLLFAPWGLFVWFVRSGHIAAAQPMIYGALGVFAAMVVLGGAVVALAAGRAQVTASEPSGTFGTAVWGDGSWFTRSKGATPGQGIPIGYRDGEKDLLYDDSGAHTLVCAPTGAGKTVGFAVPTLLSHRGSTIVLDVKGELFAVAARHRRENLGQRVRRIDPFQAAGDTPGDAFNPLDTVITEFDLADGAPSELDRDEARFSFDNAKMISEMLVAKSGEEKEPFFVDNARQFLTGLILLVACDERRIRRAEIPDFAAYEIENERLKAAGERLPPNFFLLYGIKKHSGDGAPPPELLDAPLFPGMPSKTVEIPNNRRSLLEVRRMLMLPDTKLRELLETMVAHPHPVVQGRGAQFAQMDERTFSSVVATVRSHTEFLDSPAIQKALTVSTFDFRALKDDPTTVFLVMPVERLDNYSRFVRVLIGCAQARLLAVRYKPKHPVLFLLDEFPRLQRFEKIDEGLSAHRGFGIQYLIVIQSVAQLEEAYGTLWRNFITNTTLQILWSPNDDQATKFISDTAGDRTVAYVEVSENVGKSGRAVLADNFSSGSSRTLRETKRKLIEPDEARTLDSAYCFIFSRGKPAVIARRPNYLTDPVFKGLFDDNPFHGDGHKEIIVSDAGKAFVGASQRAFRDAGAARKALLARIVEVGAEEAMQDAREKPTRFGALAGPSADAQRAARAAAQFVWTEGEERVREMLAMPPAEDLGRAQAAFDGATEALYLNASMARAQFAERCRTESPARAARALCDDPAWAGPLMPDLEEAERARLTRRAANAGARVATIRGASAVAEALAG